eukprot:Opistho-2@644
MASAADMGKLKAYVQVTKDSGPGPACYGLPSTIGSPGKQSVDVSMQYSPSYTFGMRLDMGGAVGQKTVSPGPAAVLPLVDRNGNKGGQPAYSIQTRKISFVTKNATFVPGPGAYYPEKSLVPKERHAPAYSFGARLNDQKMSDGPSPNTFNLPTLMGPKTCTSRIRSAPAFSMGSRHKPLISLTTPAPGAYRDVDPNTFKQKAPTISLSPRYKAERDFNAVPGPGAYNPDFASTFSKAPRSSLGIRHSEYMINFVEEI